MHRPTTHLRIALGLLSLGAVSACGPDRSPTPPTPDTVAEARDAQAAQPVEPAPVEVGPVATDAPPARAAEPAREATPTPAPASTQAAGGQGLWRGDGRPVWWVDRAAWRDGRFSVCAEAFGDDVRAARRAAIDAARRDAASELGGAIRDERVESAIVRAISGDATGRGRYVGYVKMTALRGE